MSATRDVHHTYSPWFNHYTAPHYTDHEYKLLRSSL